MYIYDKKTRRAFLLNAAGTAMALPFLPSLVARTMGEAFAFDPALTPQAFIFFRTYYGLWNNFKHVPDSDDLSNGWTVHPELMENGQIVNGEWRTKNINELTNHFVNPFLEKKLYELNIEDQASVILGDSSFWSGQHSSAPVLCASKSEGGYAGVPDVPSSSIDVHIHKHFLKSNPFIKALRVKPYGHTTGHTKPNYSYEYNGNGFIKNGFEDNIQTMYNSLVGPIDQALGKGSDTKTNHHQIKYKILDELQQEFKNLKTKISVEDGHRLTEYAEGLHDQSKLLETKIKTGQGLEDLTASCKSPSSFQDPNGATEAYQQMNTLLSMSIACGITKVVCIDCAHYKNSGSTSGAYHGVSHANGDSDAQEHLKGVQYCSDQLFDLALKLKSMIAPSGKNLLDASVLFHTSEFGWDHHCEGGQSILMLGKGNGSVNAGKVYDYRMIGNHLGHWHSRVKSVRHGRVGWLSYNILMESFMQIAGLQRSEYLNKDQVFYGSIPKEYSYHNENYMEKYANSVLMSKPAPGLFNI